MSYYGANANVLGSLTTGFNGFPSSTWNNNNTPLNAGWQAMNVSNFIPQAWLPTSPGITWSGTNITLPVFGIYAITMTARINTGGIYIQVVLNTSAIGNGATGSVPTNNTASEAYVLASGGNDTGPACGASTIVPLNAGSIITPLIWARNATNTQYVQVSVTLLQRLQ